MDSPVYARENMHAQEPFSTAFVLVAAGVLLIACAILSRGSKHIGIPAALIFLAVGMAAGSEGIGGIPFEDYPFAFRLGTAALTMILFDGGLNTPLAVIKGGLTIAGTLATAGVLGTAGLVAIVAHMLGLPWLEAMLLGAIISSTDAAAVFSLLKGSGLHLRKRVASILELESGLNDPMAVIITAAATDAIATKTPLGWHVLIEILLQISMGAVGGLFIGYGGRFLLTRLRLSPGGLYPVLSIGLALIAFGMPTLLFGSGFLGVYVAAVIMGNARIPYRSGLVRVHEAIAWFAQVVMFLVLGLLVFPSRLWAIAPLGMVIALFLAFVARPVVVALCLLPFRLPGKEVFYIGWVGLRGAVPIVLGMFPVLARIPHAELIFNVVFFVVVINALIPGATVQWLTRHIGLESHDPPPSPAVLEINSTQLLLGDIVSFYIGDASIVSGKKISEIPFPEGAGAMLLIRGQEMTAPRGPTILEAGDHLYVFCRPHDRAFVHLMLGSAQSET